MEIKALATDMVKMNAFKQVKMLEAEDRKDVIKKSALMIAINTLALILLAIIAPMTLLLTIPLAAVLAHGVFTHSVMTKTPSISVKQALSSVAGSTENL